MHRRSVYPLRRLGDRATAVWRAVSIFALLVVLAGCPGVNIFTGASGDADDSNTDPLTGEALPPAENVVLAIDVEIDGEGRVETRLVGTYIELSATPDEAWQFAGWSGVRDSTDNPITILATEATFISAHFVPADAADSGGPPRDSDGDGVADSQDTCPDTAADADVNSEGCAPNQRDADADGVSDAADECPNTPSDEGADEQGCAASQRDTDLDGVADDVDDCPNTPPGVIVSPNGCIPSQLDTDGDGVSDDVDQCPLTGEVAAVDAAGCPLVLWPLCGNEVVDAGEQCDPPDGVRCDPYCQIIFGPAANDGCADATPAHDGETPFANLGASDDGPTEAGACEALGADVWFCYTATCTDMATVSLCGSLYDAQMTAYEGCGCSTQDALACDDDFCGGGSGSQVSFPVTNGASYLIRVGGWSGDSGIGTITISCGAMCNNGILEPGEGCDPPDGITCDANCALIVGPVCGNGTVEEGEQCDPPDGVTCDTDCALIGGAVCGNDIVESGEQCDPPDGVTCNANCRIIPSGGGSIWVADVDAYLAFAPITYELTENDALAQATLSINAATLMLPPEDFTVLSSTVTPGVTTDLVFIDTFDPYTGQITMTISALVSQFSVDFGANDAVTWTFDITRFTSAVVDGFPIDYSERFVGTQTGVLSGDGIVISWSSASGTVTATDDVSGTDMFTFEEYFYYGIPIGSWTKTGG